MDSSIDPASAQQRRIGRVDDSVYVEFGNITLLQPDPGIHL
jgi:hypothetical protein